MKIRPFFQPFSVILLAMRLSAPLEAREFPVATDGKDSAAGSPSAPFATIQRAQQSAEPGDTILIHGGTYRIPADQIAVTGV